jgi:hypothetical protein
MNDINDFCQDIMPVENVSDSAEGIDKEAAAYTAWFEQMINPYPINDVKHLVKIRN